MIDLWKLMRESVLHDLGDVLVISKDKIQAACTIVEFQQTELEQAQARIAQLEEAIEPIYYWYDLHDATTKAPTYQVKRLKAVLEESSRRASAALKAKVLREEAWQWREVGDSVVKDYPDTNRDKLVHFFIADQLESKADLIIERESNEQTA